MLDQWFVVVSGRDMVEDIRKRPEEELEVPRGAQEVRDYAWPIAMHVVRTLTDTASSLTLPSSACLRACRPFGRIPLARVEGEAYTKPSDHPPGSYR